MKRITLIYLIPLIVGIASTIILYTSIIKTDFIKQDIKLEIELDAFQDSEMQFLIEDDKKFKAENIQTKHISEGKNIKVEFNIPLIEKPGRIRIDPSYTIGKWAIRKISLIGLDTKIEFTENELFNKFKPVTDIKSYHLNSDNELFIESNGNDPNILSSFSYKQYISILNKTPSIYYLPLILSICISVLLLYLTYFKLRDFINEEITTNHVLFLSFIVIISLPGIWMNLFPVNKISTSENRTLNSKPIFETSSILGYSKKFNAYFEDNFGFKKLFSTTNSYYKLKTFHTSSKPNTVCVGKNNWLFSTDPLNVGDYQNKTFFNLEQLHTIKHNLEEAQQWHEKRGIHFFVMILPVKSSIYPEYLPNNMAQKNHMSKLIQLRDFLEKNSSTKIIDVTNELIETKKQKQIYYKYDIHWNSEGGYIGYKKLLNQMTAFNPDLKPIPLSEFNRKEEAKNNADLAKQLSLENTLLNEEIYFNKKGKFSFDEVDPPVYTATTIKQKTIRTQIKNSRFPKAIVYRDSFFNLMIPFFSENFSDCIYLWTNKMTLEVIEKETPGYVVYEIIEADIDKLLEANPDWMKHN